MYVGARIEETKFDIIIDFSLRRQGSKLLSSKLVLTKLEETKLFKLFNFNLVISNPQKIISNLSNFVSYLNICSPAVDKQLKVQSSLCTPFGPSLPLVTGGRCSEQAFCYKN